MDAEARNTKRSRDESVPKSPQPPKRSRQADTIIEMLDRDDEDGSAADVIEISDDEGEISAMVRGYLLEASGDELGIPPPSLSSMDRKDVIEIADDDEAEKAGSDGIWDSLDEISIGRRRYDGSEFGILTEFDDGGSLFDGRLIDPSDVGCGPLDFGDFWEPGGRLDGLLVLAANLVGFSILSLCKYFMDVLIWKVIAENREREE